MDEVVLSSDLILVFAAAIDYSPSIITHCSSGTNRKLKSSHLAETCWDVLILHGWKPFSRIWNPATLIWTKQLTWLRTVRSGDWCLRSALRTLSGACQKWRWWWFSWAVQSRLSFKKMPVILPVRQCMLLLSWPTFTLSAFKWYRNMLLRCLESLNGSEIVISFDFLVVNPVCWPFNYRTSQHAEVSKMCCCLLEINAEENSDAEVIIHVQVTSSQTVALLVLNAHTVSTELAFWFIRPSVTQLKRAYAVPYAFNASL